MTPADIAVRELSRVANSPRYWTFARAAPAADWARRAAEREQAQALLASAIQTPMAFVSGQRYMALVTRLVRRAEASVDVVVPRLWPGTSRLIREALEALSEAAARGVRVRIVCANPGPGNGAEIQIVARHTRTYLRSVTGRTLHESLVVIDGHHAIVGSQSWTPNAVHRAIELSTYVEAPTLAGALGAHVDDLWNNALPGTEVESS